MLTEGKSYVKISHGPMYRKYEYTVIIIRQLFIEKNKQNFPFGENIIFNPYSIYLINICRSKDLTVPPTQLFVDPFLQSIDLLSILGSQLEWRRSTYCISMIISFNCSILGSRLLLLAARGDHKECQGLGCCQHNYWLKRASEGYDSLQQYPAMSQSI